MTLEEFNNLSLPNAHGELMKCCGSNNWASQLAIMRRFTSLEELMKTADAVWADCTEQDALEAFGHHPKIGDLKSLEKKFASTHIFTEGEQRNVKTASSQLLNQLAALNHKYEKRFGFIFIVCATGKSAPEMLEILKSRINNERMEEIKIAMEEQGKITLIRLKKLLA